MDEQVDSLSRINHKNFINLIGFCEEEEPFTRMMVLEYAPNGTLYESLHGMYKLSLLIHL
jgi:serine/threonine protein kinase